MPDSSSDAKITCQIVQRDEVDGTLDKRPVQPEELLRNATQRTAAVPSTSVFAKLFFLPIDFFFAVSLYCYKRTVFSEKNLLNNDVTIFKAAFNSRSLKNNLFDSLLKR